MSKPEILYRAFAEQDGERFSFPGNSIIEGKVWYEEYPVTRFTPTGCYVKLYGYIEKWVSLTHRKRFAYPSKQEALDNLVARRKRWLKILKAQLETCEAELKVALRQQARETAKPVGVEQTVGGPDEVKIQIASSQKEA